MRNFIFTAILGLLIAIITSLVVPVSGRGDFLAYWSAAHLLANGKNPYDAAEMAQTQQANSLQQLPTEIMALNVWNPPWLLVALFPLSILPFPLASMLWLWITILLIGLNVFLCLRMAGMDGGGRPYIWSLIACLVFFPTLLLLLIGQVSGLVLTSIVLGIYLVEHKRYHWAGAVFLLATTKPHVAYLVLGLLGWWVLRKRQWGVLAGGILAAALTSGIAILLLPNYLQAYIGLLRGFHVTDYYSATLWSLLSALLGRPVLRWWAIALLPLVFWLQPVIDRHGWLTALNVVLVISCSFAPYGFTFDQVVLLPVILQILAWFWQRQLSGWAIWLVGGLLVVMESAFLALLRLDGLPHYWFFWVPFAMMGIYALAFKLRVAEQSAPA